MQLSSRDNKVIIEVTDNIAYKSIMPQADFSLVEVPIDPLEAEAIYKQLFRTQRSNHVSLSSFRLPKRLRLKATMNAIKAEEAGFKYHDHITLLSQEEYKSIPSNLTQLGETCVLFTKSDDIRKEATAWFNTEVGDASNVWDITPQPDEFFVDKSVSRHFCTEVGVLMANCASPLICRRFLVLGLPEPSMAEFAFVFDLQMYCITTDEITARRVLKQYHKYLDRKASK